MKFIPNTDAADITGVTAGTLLDGGGTSGSVTLNVDLSEAAEATIANGDYLLFLDGGATGTHAKESLADVATLFAGTGLTAASSVVNVDAVQSGITSLGTLTGLTLDGDKNVTPGDGAMIHLDTSTITDSEADEEATAALYTHVRLEGPTLAATNVNVTTTDAATLYVTSPIAGTNQTLTNRWSILATGTGKFAGGIVGDLTGNVTGNASGTAATVTGATQAAITSCANLATVGTIGTGVWNGTAITRAYIDNDAINGDKITDDAVDSEHYTDGSIDTAHIGDDQVTFAKAVGVTPNVYGSVIKLLPSDFAANIDGGNTKLGVGYTDTAGSAYGMKVGSANTELFAFVSIPEGMDATHVDIYDKDDRVLDVFEVQINATTMVSKGTGNCNTTLDITDVTSTATNFLAIKVTTTATTDKVFGGQVTIAAS